MDLWGAGFFLWEIQLIIFTISCPQVFKSFSQSKFLRRHGLCHTIYISFFLSQSPDNGWNSAHLFQTDTSTLMSPAWYCAYHSHRSQVCQRLAPCIWLIRSPGCPMNSIFLCDVKDGGENYFNQIIASTQEQGAMTLTLHNTKTVHHLKNAYLSWRQVISTLESETPLRVMTLR